MSTTGTRQSADAVVEEIVNAGGDARAVRNDLTDPAEVAAMFELIRDTYGRLDVLVFNASGGMSVALLDRAHPGIVAARRAQVGDLPTLEAFAAAVADAATAPHPTGHTVYVGGPDYATFIG